MEIIKHGDGQVDILPKVSLDFILTDVAKSETITLYGCRIAHTNVLIVNVPNWAKAVPPTMTFEIKDPDGAVIYSQATLVESSVNVFVVERPLIDGSSFVCTLTAAPEGTGGTVTITGSLVKVG